MKTSLKKLGVTGIVAICSFLLGIVVLLIGNGVLLGPKLKVTCGTIDLKTPVKLKMELLMMKMLLQPPDMQDALARGIFQSFRESGLPEARLKALLGPAYDSTNITLATLTNNPTMNSDVKLEPYEERILKAAVGKAMASTASSLIPEGLAPEAIVFFEVKNTGRRDARNAHLIIHLTGKPYNVAFTTDNKVLSESKGSREYRVDLEAIAPNSRTKGIIWYGPGLASTDTSLESSDNEIVITYENGSIHRPIEANDFFSK